MKRVRAAWLVLSIASLVLAAIAPLIGRALATDVTLVAAASEFEVAANRELWLDGDPVAEIYGIPSARPATLVLPDQAQLVRPAEDPSLTLYLVDKQRGDNPLQLKTVDFFARWAALAAALSTALAVAAGWWLRRRAHRGAPTVGATPLEVA